MIRRKIGVRVFRSMGTRRWRNGRGFSIKEIREAGLTRYKVRMLDLPIDKRRGTLHASNVQLLRSHCIVIPLKDIKGIGSETAQELQEVGITSVQDLIYFDVDVLSTKIRFSVARLKKWQLEARKLVENL